jgi:hypothetical protein
VSFDEARASVAKVLGISVALGSLVACSQRNTPSPDPNDWSQRKATVCDVFHYMPAYRGKLVTVTGIYWYGLRETCPGRFVTGEREWPTVLLIVDRRQSDPKFGRLPFQTDYASWDRMDEVIMRQAKAHFHGAIQVTITGQVQSDYTQFGQKLLSGYGHLGSFPAQLVVKRIVDVSLLSRPVYNYGNLLDGHAR